MSDKLNKLNKNQLAAVTSTSKYLRIVAGAGSGKTRVLTTRIAYLIEDLGIKADKILAITFTNKAAKEMKDRVGSLLSVGAHPHISTIHSLCVLILRREIGFFGYNSDFIILDEEDQKAILKKIYKACEITTTDITYANALGHISRQKSAGVEPLELDDNIKIRNDLELIREKIYRLYDQELRKLKCLDFDDLLLFVRRLLKDSEGACLRWSNHWSHILVDEFQDIDAVQYEIIRYLVGENNNLCVVGDPDQTIYTWRGADVNIIMDLEKHFKGLKTIILTENYRSTKMILSAANDVISNNINRVEKELTAIKSSSVKVNYHAANSTEEEANWVFRQILSLRADKGLSYDKIAILYRAAYLSQNIETVLRFGGVPYRVYSGQSFYKRAEIKNTISYLRMLVTADDIAFKHIVNTPSRKIGEKTIELIEKQAAIRGCTMFETLSDTSFLPTAAALTLNKFYHTVLKLQNSVDDNTPDELVESVISEFGYLDYLKEQRENDRIDNIRQLISGIKDYFLKNPEADLATYLQEVSIFSGDSDEEKGPSVTLMTIHAAKGLEFDAVFVIGLNEGVFPSERSLSEGKDGEEEERRLAYVAFTRAKNYLFLSDSKGFSFVSKSQRTTSRFIQEISDEYLEKSGLVQFNRYNRNNDYFPDDEPIVRIKRNTAEREVSEEYKDCKNINWKKNEKVYHSAFKEGIIIDIKEDDLVIAFEHPHGVKKINKNFALMRRL